MLFTDPCFLFLFLPVVLAVYYFTPRAGKNFVLLGASVLFYALGEGWSTFVVLASIVINFSIGHWIESLGDRRRSWGAITVGVAVNLALALQAAHGQTALIDLAPLGHTSLHLNLKPLFTLADATRNLHRMDSSLLESFMTRHGGGLQLLAGTNAPASIEPSTTEFVRLFDMLVTHYRYVVVDNSSRLDAASRLVANLSECVLLVACTDVASLWSAARVQQYLGETGNRERLRLVLNRFRKVPGFSEADAENAAGVKLLWRVPNQYFAISSAIDRGSPVMEQSHTEIARCFSGLANELTRNDVDVKRAAWSLFKSV